MIEIRKIYYPTVLEQIPNIYDDNVDVIFTFDNNISLSIVFSTPQNIVTLMENENKPYLPIGLPQIYVKKLDYEIIERAIYSYISNEDLFCKYYMNDYSIFLNKFNMEKIKNIEYFTRNDDTYKTNKDVVDVAIEFNNNKKVHSLFCTPEYLSNYFVKENTSFLPIGLPPIFVKEINDKTIKEALNNYIGNSEDNNINFFFQYFSDNLLNLKKQD